MNWAKHVTAVAILGTWIAVGCGSDDGGGDGGTGASGGAAGDGTGAETSTGGTGDGGTTSSGGTTNVAGAGGDAGAGGMVNPDTGCGAFQALCMTGDDCCSGECDETTNTCTAVVGECKQTGAECGAATDCCSFRCDGGTCSDEACVSDNEACTGDGECCGGKCTDDACVPLNLSCKTGGNSCTDSSQCCSKLCGEDGTCTLGASFCIQPGDACARNEDCCSAQCNIAEGALLGTCNVPPSGSTFCSGVEGTVCDDCGDCCSRLCAPYAPTGVTICQPVSGCHSTGELCRKDSDCCGGTLDESLPGWSNGKCEIAEGKSVGICRNPINGAPNPDGACSPQGNVCHFKDYECSVSSARANCCGGLGAKGGVCELDTLGVPRCNGLGDTCRAEGETCASAADCCEDRPCVPDDQGTLRCGATQCIETGGTCTINADCCPPDMCIRPAGSTEGVCGQPEDPGAGGAGNEPECAAYGQICDGAGDCCNEVPCTDGLCKYPPQ